MREIVLSAKEPSKKVERFLKMEFPIGYVRKLFRKDGVRINGQRAKADDLVRAGDRIQLYIPFDATKKTPAVRITHPTIETVFEDDSLLVINKPAGLAVHEGKTVNKRESVIGILQNRFRDSAITPRLVHRLDRDTSGLLLIAKSPQTEADLKNIFESGDVGKEYHCLLIGRLPSNEGKIDSPLPGRDGNLVRALTRFRVLQRFSETTLARVRIETGRLHQIRLHFAKLGYPVVMDDQHGDFGFNKRFRKEYGLKRQFLHAAKLNIKYCGKPREWTAPLPRDLKEVLAKLEKQSFSSTSDR